MPTSSRLPDSARFAAWYSSWAAGDTSLDEARDAIVDGDAAHHVTGVPGDREALPLIVALGRLRAAGATAAGVALPVPGDPLGLAGPPQFNQEALEVGEAVVLEGAGLGLVPRRAGAGVVWRCLPADPDRHLPDPFEADTGLRRALLETANKLVDLDVARWRPEVADELMSLRAAQNLSLPAGMASRAVKLAATAGRCLTIVDLALEDEGGAVSASQAAQRRDALTPLDHAARRALVAACSFPRER